MPDLTVAGAAARAAASAAAVCISSCTYRGARSAPRYLSNKYIQQQLQHLSNQALPMLDWPDNQAQPMPDLPIRHTI